VPLLLKEHFIPEVVLLHTSPAQGGKVSLGTEVNVLPAAIESARANGGLVIAQANSQMPYTFGDAEISADLIDFFIEVDEPLDEKPAGQIGDTAREIGARISSQVENGSTLQLGIGGIPDSVIELMRGRKDLRIYTEMFSDGLLGLQRSGALNAESPITASFVFGSRELYDWMNQNQSIRMLRTETTNDPGQISKQPKMTSINAALEVDLFDQANASFVRGEVYSGFGGSTDFIVGAMHAKGGKSFMALPSWHEKANKSTVVDHLSEHVTSFQHSYVATENGLAACFGRTQGEQAWNIINHAAHPAAREWLTEAAKAKRLF
jgi:acyl-CoA hydrolase